MTNPFEEILNKLTIIENKLFQDNEIIIKKKIEEKKEKFLNVQEAMELLSLKKSTIYSKVCKNQLPYYKKGKHLYFLHSELITYIKSGKIKSEREIQKDAEEFIKQRTNF